MTEVTERIKNRGIVPVIVLETAQKAVMTARALLAGGIDVMEITFRTSAAEEAIAKVAKEVPQMLVGAGTVINGEQFNRAIDAGAKFIVSPGSDEELIKLAISQNVQIFPGIVTPSELMLGLKHGLNIFKFFPAEISGGLTTIKTLSAVFPNAKFIPTGGISEKNAADYFANKSIAAIGGSWTATGKMIENDAYEEITKKSAEAVSIFKGKDAS